MISLKKVYPSMFQKIYPLLQELDSSEMKKNCWENVFKNNWDKQEEYCGYALFDNEKVVGFLGLIFSERIINNHQEKFCNINTWFVKEEYRDYSLSLMMPIVKLKDYTLTDLSPSRAVCRLSQRLGFQELDSQVIIIFPFKLWLNNFKIKDYQITQDQKLILTYLHHEDQKILADHQKYQCDHLLLSLGDNYCYLLYTNHHHEVITYSHIQYVSDCKIFAQYSDVICQAIVQKNKTRLVVIDKRMVKNLNIPFSIESPFKLPRLYKSSTLKPENIDNLYSEIILLNISVMPSKKRMWKDIIQIVQES